MDIETRLDNLEKIVNALIKRIDNDKYYSDADVNGIRQIDGEQTENITENASDIADNRQGIEETFESTLSNADDIADVRTAIEEVYEMISEEE